MRLKVGRVVDMDKDINLMDLSPLDRIISAATNAYHGTSMYQRRYAETVEKQEEQKRKVRETLTDSILSVIQPELEGNSTLGERGDKCYAMLVKIPARFKGFLADVLTSHEFDAYSTTIIPPSESISKFFDAPYLVYIESKGGD